MALLDLLLRDIPGIFGEYYREISFNEMPLGYQAHECITMKTYALKCLDLSKSEAECRISIISLSFKRTRLPPPVQDIERKKVYLNPDFKRVILNFKAAFYLTPQFPSKTKKKTITAVNLSVILQVIPHLLTL